MPKLAIWAGLECTVNRVGDRLINQCEKSGHHKRLADLRMFAELGVERLRYPCLWEFAAPDRPGDYDWSWADERMLELHRLGLSPIVGLLHHGSGPMYTSLIDPEFPEKFAAYAQAFAERFPWVEDYTPINEPLTTARFSCLYGIWYPHAKDDQAFGRAMINQAKATSLAMMAIRDVNPGARLIQTEDMGRVQSTAELKYQRDFENERRWLSYDLLCGKVGKAHPLYGYLLGIEIKQGELATLEDRPCPPDILGLNHYLLSSRYLDHRLENYSKQFHGGNGKHRYADIAAVDTDEAEPPAPKSIFIEAWERFHIPLAVTEVHIRGYRESQLQWFDEIYSSAMQAKDEGVDFRAVTAWSLLGTFDWNSLCTVCDGFYEPGVFDLRTRTSSPRPTAISKMISDLATKGEYKNPILGLTPWWKKTRKAKDSTPIVITGARGTLGQAFARVCELRGIPYRLLGRAHMDIADLASVQSALQTVKPWAVINAAGYVKVDDAENDSERCFRENVAGAITLAQICADRHIPLVTFSSDLVFDGELDSPYTESHPVAPLNVYGRSKAECEERVLYIHDKSLVVRTSSFFGPWDQYNFVTQAFRSLARKNNFHVATDSRVSPTYVPDLVNTCLDLLIDGESGLLHLTNRGDVSWAELARSALRVANERKFEISANADLIIETNQLALNYPAIRPRYSVLGSERVDILPPLDDALNRYFHEVDRRVFEGELR